MNLSHDAEALKDPSNSLYRLLVPLYSIVFISMNYFYSFNLPYIPDSCKVPEALAGRRV